MFLLVLGTQVSIGNRPFLSLKIHENQNPLLIVLLHTFEQIFKIFEKNLYIGKKLKLEKILNFKKKLKIRKKIENLKK